MRRLIALVLCASFLAVLAAVPPARAASDKELQSMRGDVSWEENGATHSLALHASAALADADYAITAQNSQGSIALPDSSQIILGSNTRVQMLSFNQTNIANAQFVVVSGKLRFRVHHPAGQPANYTFKTPTAQLAVRGTEGDIDVEPNSLQVNVYSLSDPNLPVTVTMNNGAVYTLHAGQSLLLHFPLGTGVPNNVQVTQSNITRASFHTFSELGTPLNAQVYGLVAPHLFLTALLTMAVAGTSVVTSETAAKNPPPIIRAVATFPPVINPITTPGVTPTPAPTATPSVPIIIQAHGFQFFWTFRI